MKIVLRHAIACEGKIHNTKFCMQVGMTETNLN